MQQVLASFDTVWSRSRLMRIAGGGSVPQHSDTNHHWFYRVRVHIPVITRPEVRFFCADQNVHMAAGRGLGLRQLAQAQGREPDRRGARAPRRRHGGHVGVLAAGAAGQSEGFEGRDRTREADRLRSGRAAALLDRAIQRRAGHAARRRWSSWRSTCWRTSRPRTRGRSRPRPSAGSSNAVIEFCHDWRSLWYLHGDAPGDRGTRSQDSLQRPAGSSRELPPVRVASTGYSAQAVLNARLFAMSSAAGAASRPEAAEFNVAGGRAAGTRPCRARADARACRPSSCRRSSCRRSKCRGIETVHHRAGAEPTVAPAPEPEPLRPPVLERPIVILCAPRAGSTLLFETLAQAAGVYTIGGESHQLIESIAALRPGSRRRALQPADAQRRDDGDRHGTAPALRRADPRSRRAGAGIRRAACGCSRRRPRTRCACRSCSKCFPTRSSSSCTGIRARTSPA